MRDVKLYELADGKVYGCPWKGCGPPVPAVVGITVAEVEQERRDAQVERKQLWRERDRAQRALAVAEGEASHYQRERDEARAEAARVTREWAAMRDTAASFQRERDVAKAAHKVARDFWTEEAAREQDRRIVAERERDGAARKAARYREALEQIADAGRGVPDWRAMVDVAREALGGGDD